MPITDDMVERGPIDERAGDPSPRPPRRRRKWAEHELGELLGRAWGEDPPSAADEPSAPVPVRPEGPPPGAGGWEVERLPSEADGGVVGLLLGGRAEPTPALPVAPVAGLADETPDPDGPVRGRARLNDMIDRLPTEPVHRVTPDEVDVADPELAPPVVWFWGDDDIYPGKVPGIAQPVGVRRPKRRR